MPHSPPSPSVALRRLRKVFLIFFIWGLAGMVFSVNYWMAMKGRGEDTPFLELARREIPLYLVWAALSFAVLVLVRRHPLGSPSLVGLLVHIGCSLLFALVNVGVYLPLFAMSYLQPMAEARAGVELPYWAVFKVATQMYLPFSILLYWVTAAAYSALYFRNRLRVQELQASQLESQLSAARLEALKMQLQPHFLFNTLHSVAALARAGRSQEVVSVVAGLSDLLRRVLDSGQEGEVPLEEELRFVDRYLEIEGIRFQDRLRIERELDPQCTRAVVPALIIQPILENAFRHALEADPEAGLLILRSRRQGDELWIEVVDDGPGPPSSNGDGIGLQNVRHRLAEHYGQSATVEMFRAPGKGCCVRLRLPWSLFE